IAATALAHLPGYGEQAAHCVGCAAGDVRGHALLRVAVIRVRSGAGDDGLFRRIHEVEVARLAAIDSVLPVPFSRHRAGRSETAGGDRLLGPWSEQADDAAALQLAADAVALANEFDRGGSAGDRQPEEIAAIFERQRFGDGRGRGGE